ncbi:MAG TPA: lysophospholipid acyltransferase family protein [Ktedonobacteraceae bacterium]|nr:lysophospholipid acyltransferase family protein [Ktedonobacteraceae bacterium]
MSSIYLLARSGNTLSRWTPRAARHLLGASVGAASYFSWPSKRHVTRLNLAQVTGRSIDDPYVKYLAYTSWRNYGRYASDFMSFPHMDIEYIDRNLRDLSEGDGGWLGHMQTGLQAGRGALLVTAHFGNWDVAGAIFALHHPVSAIAETFNDTQLNQLLQDQRKEKGIGILPMERSLRPIFRILQQNQFVAIVVDRPVAENRGIEVTFFGRKTYVPDGPAALAFKSGAAIVPSFVWYGHNNEFYTKVFKPIFPQQGKNIDRDTEISRLTQSIYDHLEVIIREWPSQWYMFRQFWPSENM